MPSLLLRLCQLALAPLLYLCAFTAHAQGSVARPRIESFFGHQPFSNPVLSPDGKLLAVIVGMAGKRDSLAVIELATDRVYPTAHFVDADIGQARWVNNERLVFSSEDKSVGQGDNLYGPGMYAVNVDGSKFRQLARRYAEGVVDTAGIYRNRVLPWHTFILPQAGAQNSDSIYVWSYDYHADEGHASVDLLLLNTVTGQSKIMDRPGNTQGWVLDNEGEPRLAVVLDGPDEITYYRDSGSGPWKKLFSHKSYVSGAPSPLAFGPNGILYVEARNGRDKSGVFPVDLASGKMDERPIISAADYDFSGSLIIRKGKLAGFNVTTDAHTTMWFDPDMKAVQDLIDQQMPGTINLVSPPTRPAAPWVLVQSYSDIQPSVVQLFNTETRTFKRIGMSRPAIDSAQMAQQEVVRYTARDGLPIPALLTLPRGGNRKHLPLVVLVHGGPFTRGNSWGWDADSQFLASRGYAVLEPEFRGSEGFGDKHFRAGWKQWGLGMQNDIADGARWAIAEGIVDPKRVCIAGASYGGYAALMGVVNDPDLFKCAINWVGVTDIPLLYNGSWGVVSDMSAPWRTYGMPQLVGDLVKDAAQLKATSPLEQAARIKRPLLLVYGGSDRRVPLHHGEKFYKAVKQTNPDVEWVMYPEEGHGWALPKNRVDFWGRVEKFLDRHIGKP